MHKSQNTAVSTAQLADVTESMRGKNQNVTAQDTGIEVHQENYVENNMQTNKFGRPNKLHDS
jgi:hypothetical protein